MKKATLLGGVLFVLTLALFLQIVSVRDLVAENGESIAVQRCTVCHTLDRVERASYDREGWQRTIQRMMRKPRFGTSLSDAEQEALIEYLVSQ
jgi:mono/diheme cytochrome c family protein